MLAKQVQRSRMVMREVNAPAQLTAQRVETAQNGIGRVRFVGPAERDGVEVRSELRIGGQAYPRRRRADAAFAIVAAAVVEVRLFERRETRAA